MGILTDLAKFGPTVQWQLYITTSSVTQMVVSVCPVDSEIKDEDAKLRSLNFSGAPEELDATLAEALREHIPQATAFFANFKSYTDDVAAKEKELKDKKARAQQAQATSPANKAKTAAPAKAPEPIKKDAKTIKFEEAIKVVETLEQAGKYGQAIAKVPKALDYPQFKDIIENTIKRLRNKHAGYEMFKVSETSSAETATSPAAKTKAETSDPRETGTIESAEEKANSELEEEAEAEEPAEEEASVS